MTLPSPDEQCLNDFLAYLTDKINISTGFILDEESGNITHQVMQVSCGDYMSVSNPELLAAPLRMATGVEIGTTIN